MDLCAAASLCVTKQMKIPRESMKRPLAFPLFSLLIELIMSTGRSRVFYVNTCGSRVTRQQAVFQ